MNLILVDATVKKVLRRDSQNLSHLNVIHMLPLTRFLINAQNQITVNCIGHSVLTVCCSIIY